MIAIDSATHLAASVDWYQWDMRLKAIKDDLGFIVHHF